MNNISALDISKCFIDIASNFDENDLTNLKLQKLLYYAQGKFLSANGSRLFQEDIEAWNFGPVIQNVYETFKICGAFPITVFDVKYESNSVDEGVKKYVAEIWDKYAKYSAGFLVAQTHKNGTPWSRSFSVKKKEVIKDEDMISYFQESEL